LETIEYTSNSISFEQVNQILTKLWDSLQNDGVSITGIKKAYSVATECFENVLKHSKHIESIDNAINAEVSLVDNNHLSIRISNIINKEDQKNIKEKIEFLNGLNDVGLKKLYQYEIKRRKISNKGGAGLGLIIIAKKTNGALIVKFDPVTTDCIRVTFSFNVDLN